MQSAKYIRIYSDIHLDFDVPKKHFEFDMLWTPPARDTDKQTILVLAGDIWHAKKPFNYYGQSWFAKIASQFQYVLVVLGNHDFWSCNLPGEYYHYQEQIAQQNLHNVFLVQDKSFVIGNHKFLGGTLWTDYMKGYALCMQTAETSGMKDYKYVRWGPAFHRLKPRHLLGAHISTKDFIFSHAVRDTQEQKIWVLTHHLPSFQSIPEAYQDPSNRFDNALYYSDLEEQIKSSQIDYWVHGHSHKKRNYLVGNTRILANPRGYKGETTGYDPDFIMPL